MKKVVTKIIEPTVKGLQKDKLDYTGFIFFGLIKVGEEPFVIEYNCRLGDPETEVILPRLKNDFVELLQAAATKNLQNIKIEEDPRFASTIMAVSGGYPDEYEKGIKIQGLNDGIHRMIYLYFIQVPKKQMVHCYKWRKSYLCNSISR
jgi:phosphoribosylamine---glycine ligase